MTREGRLTPKGHPLPATRRLQLLLEELGAAKQRLLEATAALRTVDGRVRGWDLMEPFLARRSLALRTEATVRFGAALDQLHALLHRLSDASDMWTARGGSSFPVIEPAAAPVCDGSPPGLPRRTQNRRLLVEIRNQLRYLQRAFDGGSLLLARALDSFSSPGS